MARLRKPGVGSNLGAGFGLAIFLLAALGAVTYWNTSRLIEAARMVEHTRDVIGQLEVLFSLLKDAETGQRGYIITGLPSYLEPYKSAVAGIRPTMEHLRRMTSNNPAQQDHLQQLTRLVSKRLALLQDNIDLRDRGGIEAAASGIATGAEKATMDQIRVLIGRMQADERGLLRAHSTDTTTTARTALVTLSLGAALLFAFLGLIWALLRHDLLERHAAEEEVRQSEAELRTTLRSIGDAVIATDRTGRITLLNPVAERLTGWSEAQAVGRDAREVFRIVNELTRAEVKSPIARVLRESAVVDLDDHTVLISRNGAEFPIADSGAPIRDELGEVKGAVLVFRDISGARLADRDLRRLAAIVASSEDAIVGEDLDGRITAWNAAAERLFGYSAAEMIGQSVALLEPPDLEGNTARNLRRIRGGERVLQYDTTRARKDGTPVPVSISVSPILGAAGDIIGASKIARDITKQKEGEQQLRAAKDAAERANQAKDRFLAILSHELRTPLTPALAMAQVLEGKTGLPPDVAKAARLIRRNIELEALLVDDLLDLTRIAHDKIELKREPLDLHRLIENVVEICRSESLVKRQHLTLDLRADEHHADADSARMQQILWNVLKNAVKFTGAGGAITLTTENPMSGTVRIRVVDTGVGIAEHLLDRVFDPFEQGITRSNRRHGGLGLGLSISKALVELHGGSIRAESAGQGRGATFTVDLPAFLERRLAQPARLPADVERPQQSLSILVVEDHTDTADALSNLLEMEGHSVLTAGTFAEALVAFRDRRFDLLITDLGLPDGSGHDLMSTLRQIRPVQGIVLSGYGMDSDLAMSKAAGFADHLTKPVNIRKLLHVISKLSRDVVRPAGMEKKESG